MIALGKNWCPDHFVCANPQCGTKLEDKGFIEVDGKLYCESDYAKYFAPNCGKCHKPVVGVRCYIILVNELILTFPILISGSML